MREVLAVLRTARRVPRSVGDRFGDGYAAALTVLVLSGAAIDFVPWLLSKVVRPDAVADTGLLVAVAVGIVALAVRGLVAAGPVVAGGATGYWLLATPLDRRDLLARRYAGLLLGAAGVGAVLGAMVGLGPTIVTGAVAGVGLAAGTVVWQADRRAAWIVGPGMALAGALVVWPGALLVTTGLCALVSGVLVLLGYRALARLTRQALDGTVVGAVWSAAAWADLSLLTGVVDERRWLRIGTVRWRRFTGTGVRALISADLRRVARNRAAQAWWVGLAVAVPVVAPLLTDMALPIVHLIAAVVATGKLAAGLRSVGRSPALRFGLGLGDRAVRAAHVVVPMVGAVLWTVVTAFAVPLSAGLLVTPVAAVVVTYRVATRPPTPYTGLLLDTPFGMFSADVFAQLRGLVPLLLFIVMRVSL
ncbi:MAG TPA: DUF6297 family protein [Actinokineospora sp.]|nr:DUF6297 family protein [Actinokineospora sp.]